MNGELSEGSGSDSGEAKKALIAPFPYFGGKSRVAGLIWHALGNPRNYVEPFAGSLAVLLARPDSHNWWDAIETVNDADALLCNFWRATSAAPDVVAEHADWPVSEGDLHARHLWLVGRKPEIVERLIGDPEWCDAKAAGWWLWGICAWIGGEWCSGKGPWISEGGRLVDAREHAGSDAGRGIKRRRPHLGNAGRGIQRRLPHLGDAGQGIQRRLPHLGDAGQAAAWSEHLRETMRALRDRLRRVRVCCGDWSRVCGPTPTIKQGITGVFLDPPYGVEDRSRCYTHDDLRVSHDVRDWAIARGEDPRMRICLAGYEGEHEMPDTWQSIAWIAHGGYSIGKNGSQNRHRERLWFSPYCLAPAAERQLSFDFGPAERVE